MRIIAFFLLSLMVRSAYGEMLPQWQYQLVRDEGGAFSYCTAEQRLPNGFSVIFAENLDQTINFALKLPSKTHAMDKIPMEVKFDGGYHHLTEAYVENGNMLVLPLIQNYLSTILSNSSKVVLKGPQDEIEFFLPEMSELVRRLKSCVLLQKLPPITANIKQNQSQQLSSPKNARVGAGPVAKQMKNSLLPAPFATLFDKVGSAPQKNALVIKTNKLKSETNYHWQLNGIDYHLIARRVEHDHQALLEEHLNAKTIALQDRCGPGGISFIGPLYSVGEKLIYRSIRFDCDVGDAPWQRVIFFLGDKVNGRYYELSYKAPLQKSSSLQKLKKQTLHYLKQVAL